MSLSLCALLSVLCPVKCTGIMLTSTRQLAVSMLSKHALSQEHWPFTTSTCLSVCARLFHVSACLSASLPFPSICSSVRPSAFLSAFLFVCSYHQLCLLVSLWVKMYIHANSFTILSIIMFFLNITILSKTVYQIIWEDQVKETFIKRMTQFDFSCTLL